MGRKHIQLVAFFFLATAVVQMVYVNAQCITTGNACTTPNNCCQTPVELACVMGVCTNCEDHVGHSCTLGVRECCDPEISCNNNVCTNCEEHENHSCTSVRGCCNEEFACVDNKCTNCESHEGHTCEVGGPRDCCPGSGLDCAQVSPGVFKCM
ncbi:uncharacterized protein [Spinacia oleracea]|uniref:Uncharacterized protein n=1 Tax=Spinacia oleracea TaxID=3562 RepID=A0ABM3R7J5_SPIOL|nr:uncharacterized protein LOC130467180 [Spinacia oleracea]